VKFRGFRLRSRVLHGRKAFGIIAAAALVLIFVPTTWTGPAERFCQALLAPAGRYTILAAKGVTGQVNHSGPTGGKLTDRQNDRLVAVLGLRISQLERENRNLLALRRTIDTTYAFVPANIVGHDSMALPSIVIDRGAGVGADSGSRETIRPNAPVLVGIADEIPSFQTVDPKIVLGSGALVGQIVPYTPGPYTSRVKLITADDKPFPCYILRPDGDGGTVTVVAKDVAVTRNGKNKLLADMVLAEHNVTPGDLVVLARPQQFNLPINLAVGKVEKVKVRTDSTLAVDLTIRPYFTTVELDKVYVLITSQTRR